MPVESAQSGFADVGATWVGGSPPSSWDQIVVNPGHVVRYRVNTDWAAETAPQVEIKAGGEIHILRGVTVRLSCGEVVVRSGAILRVDGTYQAEALNWHTLPDMYSQGTVIIGQSGRLREVMGEPATRDLTIGAVTVPRAVLEL